MICRKATRQGERHKADTPLSAEVVVVVVEAPVVAAVAVVVAAVALVAVEVVGVAVGTSVVATKVVTAAKRASVVALTVVAQQTVPVAAPSPDHVSTSATADFSTGPDDDVVLATGPSPLPAGGAARAGGAKET